MQICKFGMGIHERENTGISLDHAVVEKGINH